MPTDLQPLAEQLPEAVRQSLRVLALAYVAEHPEMTTADADFFAEFGERVYRLGLQQVRDEAQAAGLREGSDRTRTLPMSLGLFERECERQIRSIPTDDPLADHDFRAFAELALLCVREFIDYRARVAGERAAALAPVRETKP